MTPSHIVGFIITKEFKEEANEGLVYHMKSPSSSDVHTVYIMFFSLTYNVSFM